MSTQSRYTFPAIPYLKIRFQLISLEPAHLPAYKGSLLRGAYGHALRKTVCIMPPKQLCEHCMVRTQCAYPKLFETFVEHDPPPFMRGLNTAPRPYVFEPLTTDKNFNKGDALEFDLLVFGDAIDFYPYLIYAVSQMAGNGLGRNRYPFRLQAAWWQQTRADEIAWPMLYDGPGEKLMATPTPTRLLDTASPNDALAQTVRLSFLTPTRLKFRNELTIDFTFRMLLFKMIRRVLELAHFHVPGADIDWEFNSLLVAADNIAIAENTLKWLDWQRHSNRQNTKMMMGGFTGDLVLHGDLAPFSQLLRACEILHIGKGTVFGNGKFIVKNCE